MQRILVVDDISDNRELLRNILEDNYKIETAENGKQAIEKIKKIKKTEYAAILLDLYMPEMDGFAVIDTLSQGGFLERIPILIISGEDSSDIESICLERGVSDFIHKPFNASIVRNRVKNILELFQQRNELRQQINEQEEALQRQDRIIQLQAGRLQQEKDFDKLMMEYHFALMEVETRLKVLNEEFSSKYKRNPFESITSRLKTPESIYEKLIRKGYPITLDNIREHLTDVAGLRVVCSFPDDIYRLEEFFARQNDIIILKRKDYIKNPKNNGYRSLHLIISVPIFMFDEKKYVKTELQFRTIAMDFWASLEHKMKYKKDINNAEEIAAQLKDCADMIDMLDQRMKMLRDKIDGDDSGLT